jgi:hypothetical protein
MLSPVRGDRKGFEFSEGVSSGNPHAMGLYIPPGHSDGISLFLP